MEAGTVKRVTSEDSKEPVLFKAMQGGPCRPTPSRAAASSPAHEYNIDTSLLERIARKVSVRPATAPDDLPPKATKGSRHSLEEVLHAS